jgi:hypothetical protein
MTGTLMSPVAEQASARPWVQSPVQTGKKKANFIYMTTSISKEEIEVPFGVH